MKEDSGFYIGWQEDMPPKQKSFLKKILIPLFIAIPFIVLAIVFFQKPFNNHQFELFKVKEFTGTYYNDPVPILIADPGVLEEGLSPQMLLVGYGKFGAEGIMATIEQDKGPLNGKKISLKGTLIYGDGKTVLELTQKEASVSKVFDDAPIPIKQQYQLSSVSLKGEILDPKCYFGVMKPGEGKVHKSCAIRCISGGIPPVFKVKAESRNDHRYLILLDQNGNKVNKALLPYVAEQIQVSGKQTIKHGWEVLYTDLSSIKMNEEPL